ncbi:hypothetical protein BAY61_02435 [Prauserella marina]|uniref:Uncharacterized protein n=1 Tax=Prauserella marina TaxID=530584 RepID=A0A222VJT5_9PSEU|nr:hypothetical protein [Prauserella marina]ASR34033.1 hypothetical protein BAY61_02435 [Prauserella marina]PWV82663.1 hypothetical protein DES30_102907 [Prauserella marina]SDC74135.1 hypothetical protein SAMN05421630_103443 [Prauserella marina]
MRSAHISRRQAEASFDGLDADVFAVQDAAARASDYTGYTDEEREIDALIASVDEELAAATLAASVRVTHSFTDTRRAHRTNRRADRTVLRSLPTRFDLGEVASSESEAA